MFWRLSCGCRNVQGKEEGGFKRQITFFQIKTCTNIAQPTKGEGGNPSHSPEMVCILFQVNLGPALQGGRHEQKNFTWAQPYPTAKFRMSWLKL